jgi:MFS family permease
MGQSRFFYGWVVVGVAFVCLAVAYAIWNGFSIFFVAMSADFGWSRASTAFAFSTFTIVYGLMSPVAGFALDRFGPRRVVPVGALFLSVGLLASSQVTESWQLYISYGIFTAVGVNLIGTMVNFSVLANWFSRNRGTAIGIAAAGIGVGTLILVPGCQVIIQAAGWRAAYVALAAIVVVLVPGLALAFHRHRPEEMGLVPDGATTPAGGGRPPGQVLVVDPKWAARAWTVRSATTTRAFWFLFFGMLFGTLSHQSVMVHQVAYLKDRGFDPMLGASMVGLVGISGSVGKIVWGWASDRIGREGAYALGMGCVLLGLLILGLITDANSPWQAYLYAFVFGIGYGVNAPLCSATAADLFQGRRFGSIYGALYVGSGGGSSLGPWLSGVLFDWSGGYTFSLMMSAVAGLLSIVGFWLAAPRRVRVVPGVAAKMGGTVSVQARGI